MQNTDTARVANLERALRLIRNQIGEDIALDMVTSKPTQELIIRDIDYALNGSEVKPVQADRINPDLVSSAREMGKKITAAVVMHVTYQRIADMVIGAIEGGSTYWLTQFVPTAATRKRAVESPWYADPLLWAGDFEIKAKFDGVKQSKQETRIIRPGDIKRALDLMAKYRPNDLADIISENDDANTADQFMQCLCLPDYVEESKNTIFG